MRRRKLQTIPATQQTATLELRNQCNETMLSLGLTDSPQLENSPDLYRFQERRLARLGWTSWP